MARFKSKLVSDVAEKDGSICWILHSKYDREHAIFSVNVEPKSVQFYLGTLSTEALNQVFMFMIEILSLWKACYLFFIEIFLTKPKIFTNRMTIPL